MHPGKYGRATSLREFAAIVDRGLAGGLFEPQVMVGLRVPGPAIRAESMLEAGHDLP